MKKGLITIMVGVVLLAALSFSAMAQDVKSLEFPKLNKVNIPKVEKLTLDNGMRLYILEDKSLPIFRAGLRMVSAGDDYEVLAAVPPEAASDFERAARKGGVPVTCIGQVVAAEGVSLFDAENRRIAVESPGYDHFDTP